ncbi:hypothetical protein SNE40_018446 [Patella caerulea]|uniref:SGNH hydrolase-type esterase domain-containing protein n=2 Tax=Patella caerulea TaxID=87958 RepID=A0AAN8J5H2_PATCE
MSDHLQAILGLINHKEANELNIKVRDSFQRIMRNNVKHSNPLLADKEAGISDLSSIGKLTPMRISSTRSELENNLCINITPMRMESTPKINSQSDINIRCDNTPLSPHRTPNMTEICSPTMGVQDNSVSDASMHTIDMIGVCSEISSPTVQVQDNSVSEASIDRIATDNSDISTPNIQPKGNRKLKRRKIISTRIGSKTCTQQGANSGDDFLKTAIQLLQDSVKTLSTEKQELMSVIADMKQTITEHDRTLEDMKLKIKEQGNELKDMKSKVKPQPTTAKNKPKTAKCREGNNADNLPNKATATKPKEPHIHIDTNRNQINQSTISTNNRFETPSDETNRKHTEYYKYPSIEPHHHIINKTNVVIGSSIIKYIIPRRLDSSGSTFTKTLRGAKIRDVSHYINNCSYNDNVLNVVFLVGSNDSSLRTVEHCRQDYMELIQDTRAIFPNAKIKFLTLLPRDSVAENGKLNIINRILKDVTNLYSCELIDVREKFYDYNRCCIKKGLYEDPVHINAYGTAILVRVIKCHIYLWSKLDETSNYLQSRLRSNYLNEPRDISVHDTPHHSTRDNTCNR